MNMWQRFQERYWSFPSLGLAVDLSHLNFQDDYFNRLESAMTKAFAAMKKLEGGEIANPDENRMVGHYWLRNSDLAPLSSIKEAIDHSIQSVKEFSCKVHDGSIRGQDGAFSNLILIGIGGSALGPQFVSHALGNPRSDKLRLFFLDNTDPDGMDRVFSMLEGQLGRTLCIVISKSGGTKETRNGMLETEEAYRKAGLSFAQHAVAVTGEASSLDQYAVQQQWLHRFPMWDWVGGRTSVMSAVGLLPAALQGLDVEQLLRGAKACDELTRKDDITANPAALIALSWFYAGGGKGAKDMVVLPYKDRLELFSRYLQQLIMESIGKELDLEGKVVHQGLTVYGNKGSTDQHAYVQQLRDGVSNFFVTFIEVLHGRIGDPICVEDEFTSGDFLFGFYLGTREALYEKGRESVTITLDEVTAFHVGVLIALFERAVGLYASMIKINAYHQPGVEAGKKAAGRILELQKSVHQFLQRNAGMSFTAEDIAQGINSKDQAEIVFKICHHLAAAKHNKVACKLADKASLVSFSHSPLNRNV